MLELFHLWSDTDVKVLRSTSSEIEGLQALFFPNVKPGFWFAVIVRELQGISCTLKALLIY